MRGVSSLSLTKSIVGQSSAETALGVGLLSLFAAATGCGGSEAAAHVASAAQQARPAPAVAFTRDSGLPTQAVWVVGVSSGTARRVAAGRAPSLSPDGRWIAYHGGCVRGAR